MRRGPKDRYRFSHQGKLTWLILGAVAPAVIIVMSILWFGDFSAKVQWTLAVLIVTFAAGFISAARDHVVHPLQTMSNLLAALREGDYSIRARGARADDALGEEERRAWQRLVRVLGHEMNNSLAPIKSLAGSLETLLRREPMPRDWKDDAESGLKSIASRADSLSRFMQAYTRLAKLPPPQKDDVDFGELVQRVVNLEPRLKVQIVIGPKLRIKADAAQIEQLLINLVHNAVDAALETNGAVTIGWREAGDCVEVVVNDEGAGIMNPGNLFVPFFTTKPGGSGIGLTLSRQIAAAHGGTLSLTNRQDRTGAEAALRLPT